MRPIGFVIYNKAVSRNFTKGKIYPYYRIGGPFGDGDYEIKIKDNYGHFDYWAMFLEYKPQNDHDFDFFHPPEFPEDIEKWTEDDWVHYHLKYGE